MSVRPEIVVVGSLNTDLVATVERFPEAGETLLGSDFKVYCGGKGANQAYAAGRLGGSVAMIGLVGNDRFGTAQIENLTSVGVQTGAVRREPSQPTGTAVIGVEASGENRIIYVPGANGAFGPDELRSSEALLRRAKLVLLQLEIPLETVGEAIRMGKAGGARIVLDPAPAARIPAGWFRSIDFLTPNLGELCLLTGASLDQGTPLDRIVETARTLCERGVRQVIVKLGARGAVGVTLDGSLYWPAREVQAVDTTAAGDCFNAALSVELARGCSELEAGAFAVDTASVSVTRKGAQSAMPTRNEVESFQRQQTGPARSESAGIAPAKDSGSFPAGTVNDSG